MQKVIIFFYWFIIVVGVCRLQDARKGKGKLVDVN